MIFEVVIALAAGLGLFLYGMKLMSEGLEKAAGARLRKILEAVTKNRFLGCLMGILFTAVVQSSSATTVLVVSFVNASLMDLFQAAGVILGANIGTTVTAQLIAFNLSDVAPFFLMGGVCMVMFFKQPMVKRIGEVILGFGMLFFGMSVMSGGMATLKESAMIKDVLGSLTNPFLAVFVGFIVTAVLQSSSATVGIVLLMASQGLIPLEICFFIILGCNMGSCVSALLASIGGKKVAKRAAYIHFIVNIVGSAAIMVVLFFLKEQILNVITSISTAMGIEDVYVNGVNAKIARDVANTHLIFKVFQVLVCFPLVKPIVKLTHIIVPGEDKKADNMHLEYIGENSVFSTTAALPNIIGETTRMADIAINNLSKGIDVLFSKDEKVIEEIYETEKSVNFLNEQITNYLVKANQLSLPVEDRKLLGGLFHVVNDIERIGDHAENMADAATQLINDNLSMSKYAEQAIREMFEKTKTLLQYSLDAFEKKHEEHLRDILVLEEEIDEIERQLQEAHVERLTRGECDAETGMIYTDVVSNLERVADHSTNIAFSIMTDVKKPDLTD
ncbi:MAG: Na/Pi cotransporter family protein [Lachnospiraceae bacterium]|nr:Na/Pi cotransporter family protein [Lachnospiraceae bacterium]